MKFQSKVLKDSDLKAWREELRSKGRKLVVTNGCFDILHLGHVSYLQEARDLGDVLLVGVNSDSAVRAIKGKDRPINTEKDRALVLAALESVAGVFVFDEPSATNFLRSVAPDIYVKGGDYTVDQLPVSERKAVEECGGTIHVLGLVPGRSTTQLVTRINSL